MCAFFYVLIWEIVVLVAGLIEASGGEKLPIEIPNKRTQSSLIYRETFEQFRSGSLFTYS